MVVISCIRALLINSLFISYAILFIIMQLLPYTAVGLVIDGKTITTTSKLKGVVSCSTNNTNIVQSSTKVMVAPANNTNIVQSSTKVMVAPAGVPVELRCGSETFKMVKTGAQGKYTFDLNLLEQALLDDKNCSIFVKNQLSTTDCVNDLPPVPIVDVVVHVDHDYGSDYMGVDNRNKTKRKGKKKRKAKKKKA